MIWGPPRIETVSRIDCAIAPYKWRFYEEEAARINAHWDALVVQKPRLFNGRIMMMSGYRIVEEGPHRVLQGTAFETDYKAFLAWRDFGFPDRDVINCFAMTALQSSDGAFMLGRMAEHTAASGRIYFPAGTPDRDDLKDGHIDPAGSAMRELAEETGLTTLDMSLSDDWTLVFEGPRLACMKPARAHLDAAALIARCEAFLAAEAEPELAGLVAIFSEADFDMSRMAGFMTGYMRYALRL